MYVCVYVYASIDAGYAVEPGAMSCYGNCLLTTCEVVCVEPKTVSCARVSTTSLTLNRDGMIVQQITRIGSGDVDFTLSNLTPNTNYFVTVRAENIIGYSLATATLLTLNGERLSLTTLRVNFQAYYIPPKLKHSFKYMQIHAAS